MKERYYIGIDGGGTYTRVSVLSEKGERVCFFEGDTINFNSVGFDIARKNLEEIFDDIAEHTDLDRVARVFIGCSALDRRSSIETTNKLMGRYSHLKTEMDSDLYVALFGHSLGKAGVMLVSGTGSMGIAADEKGNVFVCGGWGYAIGDEGSAYSIAADGLRAASKMADGREEKTGLYSAMMDFYDIDDPYLLAEKIYQPIFSRNKIAKFATVVSRCAEEGDLVALSILDKAAEELARLAEVLIEKADRPSTLAVYGGVLQHNKYVFSRLSDILKGKYPNVTLTYPRLSPDIGAAVAAMCSDGIIIENIKENLFNIK